MNKLTPIAAALMLLFAGTAHATTLDNLSATPNSATLTGGPVTVNLHAAVGHADGVPGSCGAQLDYGDGSMPEQFLIQVTSTGEDRSHVYSTAGNFNASIKGVSMLNPANQMRPACTGAASSPVSIKPAVAGATIVSGSASPNPAKPGESVSHTFNISHDPSIPGACGARLSFSDGAPSEDILIKASDNSIVRTHAYAAKGSYSATLTGVPISPRPACLGGAEAKVSVSTSKSIITLPASEQSMQEAGGTPKAFAIETINTVQLTYPPHPYHKYGQFDYSLTSSGANPIGCGYEALLRHTLSGATWRQIVILPQNTHQYGGTFYNLKPGESQVTDNTPPFPFGNYLLTIAPKNGLTGNNGENIPACAVAGGKLQTNLYLSAQQSNEPAVSIEGAYLLPEMAHAGTDTPVVFMVTTHPMSTTPIPSGTRCNASVIIRDKGTGNILASKRTSFPSQGSQDINLTQLMKAHGGFKAGTYEVEASSSAENLHNADGMQNNNFNCHGKKQETLSITDQGSVIEGVTWSSFQVVDDHSGKHGYWNNTYRHYEIRFMPRISGSAKCSYLIENLEQAYTVTSANANGPSLIGNFDPATKKVSSVLMGDLFTEHQSQLFRIKITGFKGDHSPCKVNGNGIITVYVSPNSAGTNNQGN